jgi:hypothetical protein
MKNLIRKILKEEVNKKYQKPTEKVERLIYNWLNNYFEGSQIYHNKSWETRHDFEFCNNGKEVMGVVLYFHNDENDYDDKRKTEERDFEEGILNIAKEIVNELASDIPVRRTYLRYVIEEWFDDTYLGEIQSKMKRTDIYINDFDEFPDTVDKCVPPMTKPEDITTQEMMDYIKANTLFSYRDMEVHEEEEPGWIEKTYLQKLRSAEYDRLNRR